MRSCDIHLRAISQEIPKEKKEGWPKETEMRPCYDSLDLWHQRQRWNTLSFTTTETWHRGHYIGPSLSMTQMVWPCKRATCCIKSITNFPLSGTRKKGRPRKTWSECVKTDIDKCGLASISPLNRDSWRTGAWHSLVQPTPLNGTRTAP